MENALKEMQDPTQIKTKYPKSCGVSIKHYKYSWDYFMVFKSKFDISQAKYSLLKTHSRR
jgi:hypothetical protein